MNQTTKMEIVEEGSFGPTQWLCVKCGHAFYFDKIYEDRTPYRRPSFCPMCGRKSE